MLGRPVFHLLGSRKLLRFRWSTTSPPLIKNKNGMPPKKTLITWSEELRALVDEALTIRRHKDASDTYVFGNLDGARYTKGGWKKTLSNLMADCVTAAEKAGVPFTPFSLQDGRPAGVTTKLVKKHTDVLDATLHTSARMVNQHYDRRHVRVATPAK